MKIADEPATRQLYVYTTLIDWFFGWQDCTDLVTSLAASDAAGGIDAEAARWFEAFQEARAAIKRAGYDGEPRAMGRPGHGPWRCSAIPGDPDDLDTRWLFLVKQDNNGTTFVASPFPLPWLGQPEAA